MAIAILEAYWPVLLFLTVAAIVAAGALALSLLIAKRRPDPAKEVPYECGFMPFGDARARLDVRFYLVAILFIVFDLEIAFLFPWAVTLREGDMAAFWSMLVFLAVLTVGFVVEWRKGALEWQ